MLSRLDRAAMVIAAVVSILLVPAPRAASATGSVTGLADANEAVIRGTDSARQNHSEQGTRGDRVPGGSGSSGSGEQPPPPGSYEPVWSTRPDTGEPCIDLVYRSDVAPNSPLAIVWDVRTIDMTNDPRVDGADSPMCQPDVVAAAPDPTFAADAFVRRIPLPEPQLRIDPGFALTGLPTYLLIAEQGSFTVNETLTGWGAMTVGLRPTRFAVDWGDGTVDTITDGRVGAPHDGDPSQQISHTYRLSDTGTIVSVASEWEATWQVGGFSGTVTGLVIDANLELPVREYRAVRTGR